MVLRAALLLALVATPASGFVPTPATRAAPIAAHRRSAPATATATAHPSSSVLLAAPSAETDEGTGAPASGGGGGGGQVVVTEDYRLAAVFFAVGAGALAVPLLVQLLSGFFVVFGAFLAFQTYRVRFVFTDDSLLIENRPLPWDEGAADGLQSSGENFVVGGENKWPYASFVNWDFFPSKDLPILVYFKETATPEAKWNDGPGASANSDEALASGAVKGQVHFFPAIVNQKEIERLFVEKGCAKL